MLIGQVDFKEFIPTSSPVLGGNFYKSLQPLENVDCVLTFPFTANSTASPVFVVDSGVNELFIDLL
jgi:hypothetical protein